MAITNNGSQGQQGAAASGAAPGGTVPPQGAKAGSQQGAPKAEEKVDDSLMDKYAGYGTEDLSGGTPYLSICQKANEDMPEKMLGQWWHSGFQKSLGKTVKVIPMGWKKVWVEKNDGRTVRVHRPDSIRLLERGSGKDYTCINPATKNKVEKTNMIVVMLPDIESDPDLEEGASSLCLMIPTVKSADAMKAWRKALDFSRTASGKKAPIFYYIWELSIKKEKNGNNEYYVVEACKKGPRVPELFLTSYIEPVLELTHDPMNLLPSSPAPSTFANAGDDDDDYNPVPPEGEEATGGAPY